MHATHCEAATIQAAAQTEKAAVENLDD